MYTSDIIIPIPMKFYTLCRKEIKHSQLNCIAQSAAKRNKENSLKAMCNGKHRERQHYVSRRGTLLKESRN